MEEEVDLVGEGGRHDEAGVAHGAAKVDKTALGQQDDVLAVLQGEPVNLDWGNDFSGEIILTTICLTRVMIWTS